MNKVDLLIKKIDAYGENVRKRSIANLPGGVECLVDILNREKPKTVLEIGTYKGVSAAIISEYCQKVITIDVSGGRLEQVGDTHDVNDFLKKIGACDRVEYIQVKDNDFKKLIIDGLDFDFAFIDGDHTMDGVSFDYELVRRCGRVLFHDYDNNGDTSVYDFVNSIVDGTLEKHEEHCFALWKSRDL